MLVHANNVVLKAVARHPVDALDILGRPYLTRVVELSTDRVIRRGTHCHWGEPAPKGCSVDVWMKWMGPWLKEYLQMSCTSQVCCDHQQSLPPWHTVQAPQSPSIGS